MKKSLVIFFLFFYFVLTCFCQIIDVQELDFEKYSNVMNETFNPSVKGHKQWKRKEWFLKPRLYPNNKFENLTKKTWAEFERYKQTRSTDRSTHGNWSFLGLDFSANGNGRLNCIAIHPTNENIIYVGASNGGVWKTTNGGGTWTNITPDIPLLAIADIKLNPLNSNEVFVLTGDGDPSPGVGDYHGQMEISSIGIIKSTNGGSTWFPSKLSINVIDALVPYKLLIHPTNPDIQFVAANDKLLRTDDEWSTMDTVIDVTTYDIEFKPGDPNIMYASGEDWISRSVDNGISWNPVTDGGFTFANVSERIELAIAPDNSNMVYAIAGDWDNGLIGFFSSNSSGQNNTWTLRNSSTGVHGAFSVYCIGLAVDPNNWQHVYGGMQWICKSTNEGVSWASIVQSTVHADIHDVQFFGSNIYVACDGGLYKSTNQGATWTVLNDGLAISEIYRIAGTPQVSDLFYVGAQDNGTMKRPSSTTTFTNVWGGDGTVCNINPLNFNIVYAGQQSGIFGKSTNGGSSFNTLPMLDNGAWISPFEIDPLITDILFAGLDGKVVRSDNGGSAWLTLGSDPFTENLNCLAQGTDNRNILYASQNTLIARCDNALANNNFDWTIVSAGLPDLAITGIAVNPIDVDEVYITFSGYNNGNKVFKSTNFGEDWINISENLPNVPINCIAFQDTPGNIDAVYIGTDIGVFYRDNNIGEWIYFSNFLPVTIVNDLYINGANNTIAAGTYGRGLWRSPLYTSCEADLTITNYGGGIRYYSYSNSITSSAAVQKDMGHSLHFQAGNFINLTPGFNLGGEAALYAKIDDCPTPYTSLKTQDIKNTDFKMNNDFLEYLLRL